jgi:hypothetical protein
VPFLRTLLAAALVALAACGGGDAGGTGTDDDDDPLAPPSTIRGPGPSYALPEHLGQIEDRTLDNASGLVSSRRTPGALWSHNDAGSAPVLYCLDFQGRSCGTWEVTGAEAEDWEDIAIGPGPEPGTAYLYVGDIGDDGRRRPEIVVYRLPEPAVDLAARPADPPAPGATEAAVAIRLRYPDRPSDAEALLVHPASGDLYIVTKDAAATRVFTAPAPHDPSAVTTLRLVATLEIGFVNARSRMVTAGDISPDGRHVALMTYAEAYEYALPTDGAGFDDVWRAAPLAIHVPDQVQGEALAYRPDSAALLVTGERSPAQLHLMARKPAP